jgi:uncharacterized protein YcfJ
MPSRRWVIAPKHAACSGKVQVIPLKVELWSESLSTTGEKARLDDVGITGRFGEAEDKRMNKSMALGVVIGVTVATAGGVIGGLALMSERAPTFAEVIKVTEATETIKTPREVCEDVAVTRQAPVKDEHKVLGTVAGAVIGGVLGNQVGGGSGKKLATVAGAAAGGYAGNRVQENLQAGNTYTTTERRCRTVTDSTQKLLGYDVTYRLGDEEAVIRLAERPGDRIPVENGELVLPQ